MGAYSCHIIPAFGVIFLKRKVGPVVLLYWSESVIIVFFNIMIMLWAKEDLFDNHFLFASTANIINSELNSFLLLPH
jgi:Family of unknown function (DUF6498)